MLKTITSLSTKHPEQILITTTNSQTAKNKSELLLALRKQRLERRLLELEPCLFQFTPKTQKTPYTEPTIPKDVNFSLDRADYIEIEQQNSPPNVPQITITLKA